MASLRPLTNASAYDRSTIIVSDDARTALYGAEVLSRQGDAEVAGLDYDSRRCIPAMCLLPCEGETTDGNRFIDAAIQAGARGRCYRFASGDLPSRRSPG